MAANVGGIGGKSALREYDRPLVLNCHRTKFQQAFEQVRAVCVSEAIVKRLGAYAVLGGAIRASAVLKAGNSRNAAAIS